jgi:hypothetical protein
MVNLFGSVRRCEQLYRHERQIKISGRSSLINTWKGCMRMATTEIKADIEMLL